MPIETTQYIRKPLYVDAVQVTAENFLELAFWCGGSITNNNGKDDTRQIDPSKQHIAVNIPGARNGRQTRAHVGDWILQTDRGLRVYTGKAFALAFDLAPVKSEKTIHEWEVSHEILEPEKTVYRKDGNELEVVSPGDDAEMTPDEKAKFQGSPSIPDEVTPAV